MADPALDLLDMSVLTELLVDMSDLYATDNEPDNCGYEMLIRSHVGRVADMRALAAHVRDCYLAAVRRG